MKKIITFLSMLFCLFATAQEVTDTMYIYRNDNIIERIPVSKIDSVVFVAPKAPAVPDVPETPVYEAIDLGLPSGVKWATCNVGATKPEEYGGYYAWGEIEEKDDYSWNTYRWCNGTYDSMTKYCTSASNGTVDNKTVLEPEDDVAHVKWGGSWRMPTKAEQDELRNNCTWTWKTLNGVNGYEVTGPNGNSIFLPAAGYRNGTEVSYRGNYGNYWSGSLYSNYSSYAYYLGFNDSNYGWYSSNRFYGLSVRPVCSGTTVPVENYTVSVSSDVNGTVSIEGTDEKSITVSADETVTVTATPADGYKFVGWFVEGVDAPISTDAAYTFAVTANISLVAKFESFVEFINGYGYVDLGLPSGLKWAISNLGAETTEKSGEYLSWSRLYDAVPDDLGDKWRVPTKEDFQELCDNCTWSWITQYGVNGIEFTSSNGNRIFLPAAGYGSGSTLYEFGSAGFYWSSTSYDIYNSFPLLFNHNGYSVTDYMSREYSLSIRLVFSEN